MCTVTTITRNESITRQLTVQKAKETRDAVAKALYTRLFAWIVSEMNDHMMTWNKESEEGLVIGVLDIFGFETQSTNSFEQLCINVANEQLHFFFNEHIFTWELKELKDEGAQLNNFTFYLIRQENIF